MSFLCFFQEVVISRCFHGIAPHARLYKPDNILGLPVQVPVLTEAAQLAVRLLLNTPPGYVQNPQLMQQVAGIQVGIFAQIKGFIFRCT